MAQSDNEAQQGVEASFMDGPKPSAPIPRYEPGSDAGLRDRLRGSSLDTSIIPINAEVDGFSVSGIEGMIDRKKANVAAKMVEADPDQALRVIRNWLLED